MATLNRGLKMVGMAPLIFPEEVRTALMNLNILYMTHHAAEQSYTAASSSRPPVPPPNGPSGGAPDESPDETPTDDPNNSRIRPSNRKSGGKNNTQTGKATFSASSDKGKRKGKQYHNQATASLRRSDRTQDLSQRQAAMRRREEQARVSRMLEDPPDKQLEWEIQQGVWKWDPFT